MNSPNYLNSHTSVSSFGKGDKESRHHQGWGSAVRSVRVNTGWKLGPTLSLVSQLIL